MYAHMNCRESTIGQLFGKNKGEDLFILIVLLLDVEDGLSKRRNTILFKV